MATLTTKHSLGELVWHLVSAKETIKLPCRYCRGSGWTQTAAADGQDKRQVRCPECFPEGEPMRGSVVNLGSWPEWKVDYRQLRIGCINVRVFDRSEYREDSRRPKNNRDPDRMDHPDEERYMCWETGVGSGTLHSAEGLFADKAEAEAEAERRTTMVRAGEEPDWGNSQPGWREWWPSEDQVRMASGFLDHRDIYEHDFAHVALAEAIIAAGRRREEVRREARV